MTTKPLSYPRTLGPEGPSGGSIPTPKEFIDFLYFSRPLHKNWVAGDIVSVVQYPSVPESDWLSLDYIKIRKSEKARHFDLILTKTGQRFWVFCSI